MYDIFLMTRTWSSNEPFLEMSINHDIYWLSKKAYSRSWRTQMCLAIFKFEEFVCLALFEATVVFQCWFATASCLIKAGHFLQCCVRPLVDKAMNCSGQCLHGNMIKLVRNPNTYNLLIELYSEVNYWCLAQILVEDELNMSELGWVE